MHAKNQEAFTAAFAHEFEKRRSLPLSAMPNCYAAMDLSQEEKWQAAELYLFTGKTLGILVIQTVRSICFATAGAYLCTGFIVRTYRCNRSNDETKSCSQKRDVIDASRSCNAIWRQRYLTLITAYQSDRQRQKGFLVWRYDHCAWLFRQ